MLNPKWNFVNPKEKETIIAKVQRARWSIYKNQVTKCHTSTRMLSSEQFNVHLKKKLKYTRNGRASKCVFSSEFLNGLNSCDLWPTRTTSTKGKKVISRFCLLDCKKCTCLTIREKTSFNSKREKCRFGVFVKDAFTTVRKEVSSCGKQVSSRRG